MFITKQPPGFPAAAIIDLSQRGQKEGDPMKEKLKLINWKKFFLNWFVFFLVLVFASDPALFSTAFFIREMIGSCIISLVIAFFNHKPIEKNDL